MAAEKQMAADEEEPLSPFSRIFSLPGHDSFNIITMGCKTPEGNPQVIIEGLKNTLINHPRFSSILETGHGEHKGKGKWIRTQVNVEEHVIIPDIDPNIENPNQFLEDYISYVANSPMDMSKPVWEFHLLRLKTSHAESVAVARFHHALGDGMSLMSLLLACTRKTSDPEALPTFEVASKKSNPKKAVNASWFWLMGGWFWYIVNLIFYTCVEVFKSMVFVCFGRDNVTPLMGKHGATLWPNKFIHRIISLDDVKFVKNAMNVTVNDVLLGMVQAGLSRYLSQRYDLETTSNKSRATLERLSLHGAVFFNLRPNRNIENLANMMAKGSKFRWGNSIGYVMLPLHMKSENDIFEYVRRAKATMDQKKLSLEPLFSYALLKLIMEVFGFKALNSFINRIFSRSTIIFTNVIGPTEEISFFGHEISYIAATTIGLPQALTISIQSYVDKVIFNFGVDETVIPNPHRLFDLMAEALRIMKTAAEEEMIYRDSYAVADLQ